MAEPAPRVTSQTVQKAVNALLKWKNSKNQIQKPQLLDEDEFVYLILTLKKIPPKDRVNAYKVPLPHSLHSQDSELCLIIDDRPKSGLTKEEATKKIKYIPISKVIKLSKLKSDYRPFEAKRKLCDSYHMFLADKRVVHLLPRLLGKQFFKKKKIPVPVDLKHKNWKEQIEKLRGSALLFLKTGTCSVVRVAKASMGTNEIMENVVAAINGIVEVVPRKWGNVRSFHLKLLDSLALPIYQTVPDLKLKIEGIKGEETEVKVKEEETGRASEDEKVGKKKKGRIHEVRYMDINVDGEVISDEELGSDDEGDMGEGDVIGDDDEVNVGELGKKKKKRKKGDVVSGGVLCELNAKKRVKKFAKVKDEGLNKKKDGLSVNINKEIDDSSMKVIKKEKKSKFGKLKIGETKLNVKKSQKVVV